MTRQDYMNDRVTFTEYYRSVAQTAGIRINDPNLIARVQRALAKGDEHLNTIPLQDWDIMAQSAYWSLSAAFQKHADFYSLADGVCVMKQAARDAAQEASPGSLPMTAYLEITASPDGRILCYETDGTHEIHWCGNPLTAAGFPLRRQRVNARIKLLDVPSRVLALQQAVVLINERMFDLTGPGYKLLWNARRYLLGQLEE